MNLETITTKEYDALLASGRSIDVKHGYPKVILHDDGTVTKLWTNRFKLFSTSHFSPYAKRFVDVANKLNEFGIATPEVFQHAQIEGTRVQLVRYRELPGRSVRDVIHQSPDELDVPALAQFYYDLHEQGILYRSIHFGNVIVCDAGGFGLIDFTNTYFYRKPISALRRAANVGTPLRYQDDIEAMKDANMPMLIDSYLKIYQLDARLKEKFLARVQKRINA
ncbi:MAG: hypothetical protein ACPG32_10245 [Akkermansiaceae bacterium]